MKEYLITDSRFKLIVIILVLMWVGIMIFFYLKADEVTKNPCSVCAKQMQKEVVCSIGTSGYINQRTFYPNFSILDDTPGYNP